MSRRKSTKNFSSASDSSRWWCATPEDFAWFGGADDIVVYHRPSGTTHLVNASSKYLLSNLLLTPHSLDEITAVFEDDASVVSTERRDSVAAMLTRFEQLGFVERV